ncbi:MAG: ABC transporter ATP-binding protein [Nocardioides sp.]
MRLVGSGLRHSYADREVLAGVDFTVGPGESVAVIGPSGMGKTTLLAILGGLIAPGAGVVGVETATEGFEVPGPWISWVLQTTNVLSDRSVLDNVRLGCLADRVSRPEVDRRVLTALDHVGLASRIDDPVRVLSGGEAQRIVIARALASRRPFLLADEPTGQLDSATSRSVMDALLAATSSRGLVLVTHDTDLAGRCDRLLRLDDGVLSEVARG